MSSRAHPCPSPSPGCFLEVLILKGFQLHLSEVLFLHGLLSPVLILLDFKSFIISDLIKNEDFMEVLILGGLGRATASECDGCDPARLLSGEDDSVVRITQRPACRQAGGRDPATAGRR